MSQVAHVSGEVEEWLRTGVAIRDSVDCVNELIENSLDAKASKIDVTVSMNHAGLTVSDNGKGMNWEELKLAGTRYATSKTHPLHRTAAEHPPPQSTTHHGWRGEALASMAVISRLTIITRAENTPDPSYTLVKILQDGKTLSLSRAPQNLQKLSCGTTVRIEGLFADWPVRQAARKLHKERDAIRSVVTRVALLAPSVSITLNQPSSKPLSLPKIIHTSGNSIPMILQRWIQLFGSSFASSMIVIEPTSSSSHPHYTWSGLFAHPPAGHPSKQLQFIFVNNRFIAQGSALHKALATGAAESFAHPPPMHPALSGGPVLTATPDPGARFAALHPMYILQLSCPEEEVDISASVHKTTVDFHDLSKPLESLADALGPMIKLNTRVSPPRFRSSSQQHNNSPSQPSSSSPSNRSELSPTSPSPTSPTAATVGWTVNPSTGRPTPLTHSRTPSQPTSRVMGRLSLQSRRRFSPKMKPSKPSSVLPKNWSHPWQGPVRPLYPPVPRAAISTTPFTKDELVSQTKFIAQVDDKYLIATVAQRLVAFDQHAVHERIRVESLGQAVATMDPSSVSTVFLKEPVSLVDALTASELNGLVRHASALSAWGWVVAPNSVLLASPNVLGIELGITDLRATIASWSESSASRPSSLTSTVLPPPFRSIVNSKACRGAIKFNTPLAHAECLALLADLAACQFPFQCAHGRPSLAPLSDMDLLGRHSDLEH